MMELQGKYEKAIVYTDNIEEEAIQQIYALLNNQVSKNSNVRIMPDVHAGSGCVIGYTAKLTDKIIPNLIGVDIGCGVTGWNLGPINSNLNRLVLTDNFIKNNIPNGRNIHDLFNSFVCESVYKEQLEKEFTWNQFLNEIYLLSKKLNISEDKVLCAIGSLGGGNHFIEFDKDESNNVWLLIHSGSRNLGLKIARYHQDIADGLRTELNEEKYKNAIMHIKSKYSGKDIEKEINKLRNIAKPRKTGLEYLEDDRCTDYCCDMDFAQLYAQLNRRVMGEIIIGDILKKDIIFFIESIHNYINFKDGIIRKGAISSYENEDVIIPLNMKDGVIIGKGKGNSDWNYSAPHGSGRIMSRSKAKQEIKLDDFEKSMEGIYTTCVNKKTIDESCFAYKPSEEIINSIKDTVEIKQILKPIYNFKAEE